MLVGRKPEIERIDALLDSARSGAGCALAVVGEPGIGKTTLLDAARERAQGMTVASATGIESEASLPYAALAELAEPLLSGIDRLPAPQAEALAAALALGPAPAGPGDPLPVRAGFLGLVRAAAAERPVLVVVDDAHWLDSASAASLVYVARRIGADAAAILIARRDTEPDAGLGDREIPELRLAGLEAGDAAELVRRGRPDLARAAAAAVVEVAMGNPLALVELPPSLSEEQRRGLAPLAPPPTPAGALADAFGRRLDRVDEAAREALLVAAAASDHGLGPVVGACGELGIDRNALERAEEEGLIACAGERFAFAHPLLRAFAYSEGPAAKRRRAHRALAAHTRGDARAWHLAAAALGPDEEAARALEEAAQRASARGAYASAADALERSAGLTAGDPAPRLFGAGLAAALGGDYERGMAVLDGAGDTANDAMRTAARHLQAMVALMGGIRIAHENHGLLTREAERRLADDPGTAAMLFADTGVIAAVAGDCRLVLASAERAIAALPADAPATTRCQALSILGMGLALAGRTDEGREAMDQAGELLGEVDPLSPAAQSISFALGARVCTGQERLLHDEVRALAARAREGRSLGLLPYFQLQAADSAFRLGDWEASAADAESAVANAEASGQLGPLSIALVIWARGRAVAGDGASARTAADRGIEIATPLGYGGSVVWARAALGLLELGLERPTAAIEELEQARALAELAGLEDPVLVPWAPDLVEAYVRAGREGDAVEVALVLDQRARRSGVALALGSAARCRGMIAERDFEPEFERAIAHHAEAALPFELARTELAFGRQLHRARRRTRARELLRSALSTFERLGAAPWAEQARAELTAAGGRRRGRFHDPDELTAQEVRIALAVARGAKNREVAAELFLSPKTIEFHLGRVYRKLGIRSRTELAGIVAEGRLMPVSAEGADAEADDPG